MSCKLIKSQEDETDNLSSLPVHFTRPRWNHTWSFNLHKKPLLSREEDCPRYQRETKRKIRKYYGKKIFYITRLQEIRTLVSRAKILKYAEFKKHKIYKNSLKYKGDLVLIGADIRFSESEFRKGRILSLKKALRHCQEAHIEVLTDLKLRLLRRMRALRNLTLSLTSLSQVASLGRIILNFLNLEEIEVKYVDLMPTSGSSWIEQEDGSNTSSRKNVFFSQFLKLSHLKKLKFICDYEGIQGIDLDKLYKKPLNFDFQIRISAYNGLDERSNHSSLWRILNAAEYLKITDPSYSSPVTDVDLVLKSKEEGKSGKVNLVEILITSFDGEDDDPLRGDDDSEENVNTEFSSPLLTTFSQIKDKCLSLKHLTISFSTFQFPDMESMQKRFPNEFSAFLKNLNEAIQEISAFEKLKSFELITSPEKFYLVHPDKFLSNNNLEMFKLKLSEQVKRISRLQWDRDFLRVTNQIKEFSIKVSPHSKTLLFEMNLLNFLKRLESLERVELIDKRRDGTTLDFLHGFVINLLDKREMRKILIETKVINSVYSKDVGVVFSKNLESQFDNMVKGVCEDWEKRIKVLKELKLEQISVGKLKGFGFECLFWDKKMQAAGDKIFWIENELKEFLKNQK